MRSRREYLAAVCGVAGLVSGGCLDTIGSGSAAYEAAPSRVGQQVLDIVGYSFEELFDQVTEEEFSAGGASRTVEVTNKFATYTRNVNLGPFGEPLGAVFSSVTTPQVTILGREFNPVERMSTTELAETIQDQFFGIENLSADEESEVTVSGTTTTETKFTADAGYKGSPIKLCLHVSEAVRMGDDFLVTVGLYPELLFLEEYRVRALMEAVEPAEEERSG